MKTVFRFLISGAILLCSLITNVHAFSISQQEINQYLETRLAEKIPLKDKVGIPGLFQLDYHLYNLSTEIGQTDKKKVAVSGVIEGILQAKGKKYDARIALNMDTMPYYDAEKGTLYLKDIRLLSYTATPAKYQDELQVFLPVLMDGLTNLLNHTPVYTLDENKAKEALVKKFGKAIVVEKGELRLETSVF
ncbi:DUF1439 domain-containing protein [Actinobacillus arthritidis]|uniref:DUF1439 domain-containing protein n=1 Tax=Actinobacillus arthritidis TaxID=157339 RepID=UPI0024430F07|nr:DUF1439 domain-containing protein [Actinobacillus arthritidis]WGE89883.1 DUF1439 domain-containing protein [Actinobacillus arthritidis]